MGMESGNGRGIFVKVFLMILFAAALALIAAGCGEEKADGGVCASCHENITPGIVGQWKDSAHSKSNVACIDCHRAREGDPDAFSHNGELIATIVSPSDCSGCHQNEEQQFSASYHAKAAQFIGSLDNFLGEAVEGTPAANSGCKQCHGSTIKVLEGGRLDPATWPNTGMGRVNPDGSKGSCTACHARHDFSKAQAREPDNCGKCHMGPDHPQKEIYEESKHGILFKANHDEMNLNSMPWVVGKDYSAAPTCATCHMSATPNQPVSHDVGARISWTLRPVISTKMPEWEKRRGAMKDVCNQCHAGAYTENFYNQFDDAVNLYNTKFAAPAKSIMDELTNEGLVTKTPFDDTIEWTYYELWHHEGRRARQGASMMGPDYTQWHGFYEVAKHFYSKFLPEAEALKPGVTARVMEDPYHKWAKGLSKEEMQKLLEFYQERYGQ